VVPLNQHPVLNRVIGAVLFGTAGLVYGIASVRFLYPDTNMHGITTSHSADGAARFAGICWAVAGAFAAMHRVAMAWMLAAAVAIGSLWILLFGTAVSSVFEALTLGAPLGAGIGAIMYRVLLKIRHRRGA
jgi:hypothetical protein